MVYQTEWAYWTWLRNDIRWIFISSISRRSLVLGRLVGCQVSDSPAGMQVGATRLTFSCNMALIIRLRAGEYELGIGGSRPDLTIEMSSC